MANRNQKRLQVHTKDLKAWLIENGEYIRDRSTAGAEQCFSDDPWTAIKILSIDLLGLGTYYGIVGILDLIDGNPEGWRNIDRSLCYRYWEVKLAGQAFSWRPDGVAQPTARITVEAAHVLAYSLAMNIEIWRKESHKYLSLLSAGYEEHGAVYWYAHVYEPFIARLEQKVSGAELLEHLENCELGPYTDLFAYWYDNAKLSGTLEKICDYHCENMIDKGGIEEFDIQPFDLYPVEILAIYRVREQLGLETPIIDHPLMATPLASLRPRTVTPIDDPVINSVEKLYRDFFGADA